MDEGPPELLDVPGGPAVRYRGRLLYSDKSPRSLPERAAASIDIRPGTLLLCASPLLGYGLETLLARLQTGSAILCIEADPRLHGLSESYIPESIKRDPRISFAMLPQGGGMAGNMPDIRRFRRCELLLLSGGAFANRAAYEALRDSIDSEIRTYWRNRATMQAFGRLWMRNVLMNLPLLPFSSSLAEIRPLAAGLPIVLCGAGPSLERGLPYIARMRRNIFLISADTALPALGSIGVLPNAVVCLDAQIHNSKDFIGSDPGEFVLIADITSHPSVTRLDFRRLCLVSSRFAPLSFLDRMDEAGVMPEEFPALGSVGVAALRAALALRDPEMPVLVSGLDFSFERGKTHGRGTSPMIHRSSISDRLSEDLSWRASARKGVRVLIQPGAGGTAALLSDPALESYATAFIGEATPFLPCLRDIRGFGADLGIHPPAPGSDPLGALDRPMPPLPLYRSATPSSETVRTFLEAEKDALAALRSSLSGERATDDAELLELLSGRDYLYSHFPDGGIGPLMERHFLSRAAIEADSFLPRFARAIEELRAGTSQT